MSFIRSWWWWWCAWSQPISETISIRNSKMSPGRLIGRRGQTALSAVHWWLNELYSGVSLYFPHNVNLSQHQSDKVVRMKKIFNECVHRPCAQQFNKKEEIMIKAGQRNCRLHYISAVNGLPVLRRVIELDQPRIQLLHQDPDDVHKEHKINLLMKNTEIKIKSF